MLYLFLDESGDLGFDFVQAKPSEYFVISIVLVSSIETKKILDRAVRRTLRNKVNAKTNQANELKGSHTSINIKRYLWRQIEATSIQIYSVILRKRDTYSNKIITKAKLYNAITEKLLVSLPLKSTEDISLIIDRCKSSFRIREFNKSITSALQKKLNSLATIDIDHINSYESPCLQIVDLLSWGIFRKYEKHDLEWYQSYQDKILAETIIKLN